MGRQSGDGAAAEGCGGVKTPPYEAKGKRVTWQSCGAGMPGPYGLL